MLVAVQFKGFEGGTIYKNIAMLPRKGDSVSIFDGRDGKTYNGKVLSVHHSIGNSDGDQDVHVSVKQSHITN